jgi:hypothetical protein
LHFWIPAWYWWFAAALLCYAGIFIVDLTLGRKVDIGWAYTAIYGSILAIVAKVLFVIGFILLVVAAVSR